MDKKSNDWPERAQELQEQKRLSRRRLPKLADKTRELNAREEDLDGRSEALKRSEEPRIPVSARITEARKEAEKLEKEARAEANAITVAEEEAKGIVARAKAKNVSAADGTRYCGKSANQQDDD